MSWISPKRQFLRFESRFPSWLPWAGFLTVPLYLVIARTIHTIAPDYHYRDSWIFPFVFACIAIPDIFVRSVGYPSAHPLHARIFLLCFGGYWFWPAIPIWLIAACAAFMDASRLDNLAYFIPGIVAMLSGHIIPSLSCAYSVRTERRMTTPPSGAPTCPKCLSVFPRYVERCEFCGYRF